MLGQSELTILVEPQPALEDLPGHHHRDHRRRRLGRRRSTTRSSQADRSATTTIKITPDWRTLRAVFRAAGEAGHRDQHRAATSARRRCGAWCWATTTGSRPPARARADEGAGRARRWSRARSGVSTSLAVPARALRQDRGADRAGGRGARYGGIYATHMRSRGRRRSSRRIDEAIRIGREAQIPVEIWHLKVGRQAQLGPDAGGRREDRRGAARRRRHHRRHLRLPRVVQLASPPSFRRGRTTAATRS